MMRLEYIAARIRSAGLDIPELEVRQLWATGASIPELEVRQLWATRRQHPRVGSAPTLGHPARRQHPRVGSAPLWATRAVIFKVLW